MTATPIFVTKFSLSESLGCALRDLRIIDQFSPSGRYAGPAFLARKNCVIINLGHVRAIVMRDQVYIFMPEMPSPSRAVGVENEGEISIKNDNEQKFRRKTEKIESFVEALVTYLNSIYHSSHLPLNKVNEDSRSAEYTDQRLGWYRSSFTGGRNKNEKKRAKQHSRKDNDELVAEQNITTPPFELGEL